jgi:23S rRNA (cytosine1962-C5)-methyltransferase
MIWLPVAQLAAFDAADTNAHRVCSSGDGWIERLGEDALICHKSDSARDQFAAGLAERSASAGWRPRRVFAKFLPRQNAERVSPTLLSGDAALPATTVVHEAGVRYGIDFSAGYSHGLFLDQRANRAFLRRVAPKRLLNTFAYTCSFSVVAALAGSETLSVDLSKKSLDRGRENFALNDLPVGGGRDEREDSSAPAKTQAPGSLARHRFLADDVLEVLPRLARRGEKFDAIVLDPPTFSRGNQGRRWQVEQHFEDLLSAALELAAPEARLLLSTNCAKLDVPTLERAARFCAKVQHRGASFHREPALPDFPPGHGASTLWMTVR